jgi:tetratricopeptide (TPR) repeat protein
MEPPEELVAKAERFEEEGREHEAFQMWAILADKYRDPDSLFHFALLAKKLGEIDQAQRALELLVKLEPRFDGAHLTLASIALGSQAYDDAERHLRKALSIEETRAGFTMLGVALRHLGRDGEAEESYRRAIELDPEFDEAYYNLGVLLRDTAPAEAESLFVKALQLDSNSTSAHRELGWIYGKLGRIAEAELHVRKAIELSPDDAWAHIYLGNILWRKGEAIAAESEFKWAHEAVPDWAAPLWALANLSEDQEDWTRAQNLYERALEAEPDDAVANMNLGRMLVKKGEPENAAVFLKRALLLNPRDASAKRLLADIGPSVVPKNSIQR